ncbi:MAG: methionyl-tRNA formyltransferase, partial [Bacteroidales bacterium]|nr:methionyl-tRNA formyltransferase [Bacteroidales bacterium]
RGAAPINWAIINGEHLTGVTTFMIDEQIDTGAILFNEVCQIEDYDDAGSLHDKLMIMGAQMVVKTAEAMVMGSVKPKQQANYKNLHSAPKITKETCRIDWSKSAYEISLLVRGLSPYPAAFSLLAKKESEDADANGVVVKIYEASEVSESSGKEPGTISTDGKSYLEIACGEGALRITSLQMAGKKRLEVTEFLKGFRDPDLYRLV